MPSLTSADLPLYVNLVISSAKLDCRRKAEDEETKASDPTAMTAAMIAAMMKMRMLDYGSALTSGGGGELGDGVQILFPSSVLSCLLPLRIPADDLLELVGL